MTLAFPRVWYIGFWIAMALLVRWWLVALITREIRASRNAIIEAIRERHKDRPCP